MMGDAFWTQKTTPQEWLQKVRNGRTWQKQREKLETAFAENSGAARKRFAESMDRLLISDVVKGYWDVFGDIGDVLSEMWDDMDLTESNLQLNVIGMLTEEWIKAYGGQKAAEEGSGQVSYFHSIIQNVDEEKLMAELHKRITPSTKPAVIGATLAYCYLERHWFIKVPSKEMFEKEFPNCGNWNSIRSYFNERNREKAKSIVIEL